MTGSRAGIQHSHPALPARLLTGWCITGAQPGSHRKALSESGLPSLSANKDNYKGQHIFILVLSFSHSN